MRKILKLKFSNVATIFKTYGIQYWLGIMFLTYFIRVHNKRVDFPCYYNTGKRFFQSQNLYNIQDIWPFKYLPSTGFFFQPLALFDLNTSKILFFILSFITMFLSYKIIIDILTPKQPFEKKFIFIPFLLSLRFHFYDYANLQINTLMLFLILWGFQLLHKKKYIGAVIFSIGAMAKIIPSALVLYYLLKKQFKSVFTIISSMLIIQVIPFLYYGTHGYRELFQNFLFLMNDNHSFFDGRRIFQSLPAMIERSTNFMQFGHSEVAKFTLLGITILICTIPLLVLIKKKNYHPQAKLLEFSYCLLFYPLVNPVGWRHSYIFITPAVTILFYYIVKKKLYNAWSYRIGISFYLIFNVISSKFIVRKTISHFCDHLSFNVMSIFVLFYLLFITHKYCIAHSKSLGENNSYIK